MNDSNTGKLYLVATPIGNLGDISDRAAQTLRDADFIAAEDTRVTLKLLGRLDIRKPLVSYHEHNRTESGEKIANRILAGESCALVTDAGTPGISDPGEDLIRFCVGSGIQVIAIPGPCAAISALAVSGLPSGRFTFEGFLSTARKRRFDHLGELRNEKRTMIFYEAPHKLLRTLRDMLDVFGDRRLSISRELTKIYEQTFLCTFSEAIEHYEKTPPRGEFVLVIEGSGEIVPPEPGFDDSVAVARLLISEGLSVMDAVKKTAAEKGVSKNALYNAVVKK